MQTTKHVVDVWMTLILHVFSFEPKVQIVLSIHSSNRHCVWPPFNCKREPYQSSVPLHTFLPSAPLERFHAAFFVKFQKQTFGISRLKT